MRWRTRHPALWLAALLAWAAAGCARAAEPLGPAPALAPTVSRPSHRATRLEPAPGEFRGAWVHWQDYATPDAIARTIARARRGRLNALLPLANYPHQAMWRSRLIPVNPRLPADFDPLRELVARAREAGLQVHPYLLCLNGGLTKHPNFAADWYAVDPRGQRVGGWLNPSHPEVRAFLAGLVAELAETGVDGIHFDYIRHEYDTDYDYSPLTRQRFQAAHGFDPLTLHQDAATGDGLRLLKTAWHDGEGAALFGRVRTFCQNAGYRPPITPERFLRQLSPRTVLLAPSLYSNRVQGETLETLLAWVERGGVAVILDGPEVTSQSRRLAAAVGLSGKGYFDEKPVTLTILPEIEALTRDVPAQIPTELRANACPTLEGARPLALFDDGAPAITYKPHGGGAFVVINFHCQDSDVAYNQDFLKLFSNLLEWLASERGFAITATVGPAAPRGAGALWDTWRREQVTELVAELVATARRVNPGIITSAAAGTQREDLARVRRDGRTWLQQNLAQFLCPMAYTTDNATFQKRLSRELAPLTGTQWPRFLFCGIGVYKAPDAAQRWLEQVQLARRMGFGGVCFFSFEYLTDATLDALAAGPFRDPAPLPWRQIPIP